MSRNHQFKNDYMKIMKKLISNRYATELVAPLKKENAGIYLSMDSITKISW